jgi:O-succinylbenzoic acid--CoA ligase
VASLAEALADAMTGGPTVLPYETVDPPTVPAEPADTALIIATSGSTGAAKRVMLSPAALRASTTATHQRLGGPGRWLLALPAHHIAGAQVILRGLLAGFSPTTLDIRAGFRAEGFAAVAEPLLASGDRCYTALVPTQLHRLLAESGPGLRALLGFEAVLVGGAATPEPLLTRARERGVRAVTTYGMSETAGGCVYDGVPLEGARFRLSETGSGRIELAGPMLASGYLGEPDLTAESFADGWFRTSDAGQRTPDGRLRVLGRVDDVITTGGESVHPAAVERVLNRQTGVRAACVVGVADAEWGQLVAAAVVPTDPDGVGPDQEQLRAAVRTELGSPAVPRRLRIVEDIPLRGIGKPDRARVADMLS